MRDGIPPSTALTLVTAAAVTFFADLAPYILFCSDRLKGFSLLRTQPRTRWFIPPFLDATLQSMDSSDLSDGPITLQEYLEVKKALASSEAKVQQLMKVNNNLSEELRRLQKEVWTE